MTGAMASAAAATAAQATGRASAQESPSSAGDRPGAAPGSRLAEAFEAVERFPVLIESRELDVLRHLSEGMVYKQIASEMQLSVSTIRTHLHNVYGKIGAVDRALAVLTARDRGWI